MAAVAKIDSNFTGLSYAEEASLKVLPVTPVWHPLEPNSYADFGGQITKVARNPINSSRQRKKGVTTDLEASGGFDTDFLPYLQDILQGFFFADLRRKGEGIVSGVTTATDKYELDHAEGMFVNSLVLAKGHTNSANNGVKVVTAVNSVFATGVYTLAANVANNDTVTLDTTVYTWKTVLTGAAYEVLIGGTASISLDNLIAAITGAAGLGTLYGSGTVAHTTVTAAAGAGDTMNATARRDGPGSNTIATTEVGANSSWGAATLTGGDADITVSTNLVDETPAAGVASIVVVGFQFASADATITNSGTAFPVFGATAKNLTQLGLVPGEWFFIGGDLTAEQFATAADNGFVRARSITATAITIDKSQNTLVTDAGAGKTIRVFLPRVLKNELGTLIKRRTYNLERTLGAPDGAFPSLVQSEYLIGSVPNEFTLNIPQADKVTSSLSFVGLDVEQRTAAVGVKTGTRAALEEQDAINTSSDFTRIKLSAVSTTDAAPTPLFAYVTAIEFTVNNNVTPNKAVGVLGAFEATAGQFTVSATLTAYLADVQATAAVRNNTDMTFDIAMVRQNSGVVVDFPLVALGDGRPNVEQDQAITLPLTLDAATAAKVAAALDYTMMMNFFDYLPSLADI